MEARKIIKAILYPALRFLRYSIHRYILNFDVLNHKLYFGVKLYAVSDNGITFFGYYNISPTNSKEDVLFLKVNKELVRGSLYEPARIMLKNANGDLKEIYQTKAWNWQQGCMLQWLHGSKDHIIFNDFDEENNQYCSKVINREGLIINKYDVPIYNISKIGDFALSLNFKRLAKMRPDYGYFCNPVIKLPTNDEDGVWKINLHTKQVNLIISLSQLIELDPVESMQNAQHKVNHIDIAPNGERFMFLHRWVGPQGRFMRLITANKIGEDLYILNGDKMTSHSCWFGNEKILSFCYTKEYGNTYTIFVDKKHERYLLSHKLPNKDGHPSVSPDGKWLITDTYPELDRMSKIILYNIQTDELNCIGQFYQPLKFSGEKRIDLHPKWSIKGDKIYFESGHNGKRNLYYIELDSLSTG